MSFNKFLNNHIKPLITFVEDIANNGGIGLIIDGERITYRWDARKLKREENIETLLKMKNNTSDMLEIYLLAQIVKDGPKVFQVEQLDFEVLTEMTVNLKMEDYVQPFDTVIIQLPSKWYENKIIPLPQAGKRLGNEILPDHHQPDWMVIHFDKPLGTILFALYFTTGISIKTGFSLYGDNEIEPILEKTGQNQFKNSMETNNEEIEMLNLLLRGAINYCLLVDEIGSKIIPNSNRDKLLKSKKRTPGIEREIRLYPVQYELKQQVQLYDTVSSERELETIGHTGRKMGPHRRRGHYRMQACGKGFLERKRIRIKPVFVNKHLFLGSPLNNISEYRT